MSAAKRKEKTLIGWSEYIDLPDWGIEGLKAKVDTGARSSALHVEELREVGQSGREVEFEVVLSRKRPDRRIKVRAHVLKWARVRSSTGIYRKRCFVRTRIKLGPVEKEIELSLVSREKMLFRMLIGRKALERDFLVDVNHRSVHGKRKTLHKKKKGNCMKIAILSRSPRAYSTRRLRETALARGHKTRVLDTLKFSIGVEQEEPELYYRNRPLSTYDAVLPRIGASITFYGLAVLRQFEQMGTYAGNESIAISRSRDKLRSMQILSRHDIGIPPTAFVRDKHDVLPAIERVGGAPVIIKVLEGTQGVGVILADTNKIAEAIIETLQSARQYVLIQKFIKESKGRDLRAIVVGDRVVAAMRRKATGDEFRSNVHRGGTTEAVELDEEYTRTAIRAAQIMGLRIAGVDILESNDGPQVMEVNSSPGLEGIETVTGLDVAGAIIEDIEYQVQFPDVDLRQRLRLVAGYGVGEFTVHNMPELEDRALRETDLDDRDIHVLHINRDAAVIANPKGDEVILTGDTLLCYGDLGQLRALVPAPSAKRRRHKKIQKLKKQGRGK